MALDLLQQFLGGDPRRQQEYGDFLRRYQEDPNSISDEEAARRYRELLRHAPPDLADEANEQAFGQLPQQDRRWLAERYREATRDPNRPYDGYRYDNEDEAADPRNLGRMTRQAEEQDGDLLDQLIGKNSPLNSTVGRAALAAGAAYLASRVFGGQGRAVGGGGIPGLFGGQRQEGGIPGLNVDIPGRPDKQI